MSKRIPTGRPRGRPRIHPPGQRGPVGPRKPTPPTPQVTISIPRAVRKDNPRRKACPPRDPALVSKDLMESGLLITLQGRPLSRPEPRGAGKRRVVNASGKVKRYIAALERVARQAVENVGGQAVVDATFASHPIIARVVWSFPTKDEARWGKLHTHKPDVDNLEKLLLDALKRSGAFGGDDAKIAAVQKRKEWDMDGFVWVSIAPVREETRLSTGVGNTSLNSDEELRVAPRWLRG